MIPNNFIYMVHEGDKKCMQHFSQKTWKEETIWDDNIELNFKEIGCGLDWIIWG
jgi:hypothetical protein